MGRQDAVEAGDAQADESTEWLLGRFTASHWITVGYAVAGIGCLAALGEACLSLRRTNPLMIKVLETLTKNGVVSACHPYRASRPAPEGPWGKVVTCP
ncbi:hypothetical protein [Streptomyces sp. NPDC058092]|uniref:hypothetical protein n=1 Tax=Streptomyces sp. NPDC058092 TaxID=3346336 RepID=UPI0036DFB731